MNYAAEAVRAPTPTPFMVMNATVERVHELEKLTAELAARLCGEVPAEISAMKVLREVGIGGLLGEMQSGCDAAHAAISRAETNLRRVLNAI